MTIYTYGCSWSYGVLNDQYDVMSWPEKLAEKLPNHNIEDYSLPGTDLQYSVYHLWNNLKSCDLSDIHIFQATAPWRFTYWPEKCFLQQGLRTQKTENYSKFKPDVTKSLKRYFPRTDDGATEQGFVNPDLGFHKKLYHHTTLEQIDCQHQVEIMWANSVANLTFCWFVPRPQHHLLRHIPIIDNVLGPKDFQSYVHDPGQHFNDVGCERVADWVIEQIQDRL